MHMVLQNLVDANARAPRCCKGWSGPRSRPNSERKFHRKVLERQLWLRPKLLVQGGRGQGGGQWCYGGGQGGYSGAGVKGRVGKISAPPVPQNTERSHFQLLPHSQIVIFLSKPTNTKDNLDWCPK